MDLLSRLPASRSLHQIIINLQEKQKWMQLIPTRVLDFFCPFKSCILNFFTEKSRHLIFWRCYWSNNPWGILWSTSCLEKVKYFKIGKCTSVGFFSALLPENFNTHVQEIMERKKEKEKEFKKRAIYVVRQALTSSLDYDSSIPLKMRPTRKQADIVAQTQVIHLTCDE